MKPFVLFVVTSDPRNTPRPVEALRIAVGTAAWRRVDNPTVVSRKKKPVPSSGRESLPVP